MGKGLEEKMCQEQLRSLGLFSPKKRRQRKGLITAYSFLRRGVDGQELVSGL